MTHTSTQQPEALNLEEFRTAVTHAAREPLLARIAELEEINTQLCEQADEADCKAAFLAGMQAARRLQVVPLRKQAVPDERKSFDAANLRDYFGGPLSYRERDIAFMAWQARAELAAQTKQENSHD